MTTPVRSLMLQEILAQPAVLQTCLDWLCPKPGANLLLTHFPDLLKSAEYWQKVQIIACGSSFHAGLVGQYLFEQLAGLPTSVYLASEFRYSPPPPIAAGLTIGITQSGKTTDTLGALALDRSRQTDPFSSLLVITNERTAELEQLTQHILQTPAGQEQAIAATKSFTAQLLVLTVLALGLAYQRHRLSQEQLEQMLGDLQQLPDAIQRHLDAQYQQTAQLATQLQSAVGCVFLGRGIHYPIALEAALKVKETCYIFAEGYAEGEFSHGPLAILEKGVPVVTIALPTSSTYSLTLAAVERMKSFGATVIGVTSVEASGSTPFNHMLQLPAAPEWLSPILTIVPLQLLAYHLAQQHHLDVDRPRHLTKAVLLDEPNPYSH